MQFSRLVDIVIRVMPVAFLRLHRTSINTEGATDTFLFRHKCRSHRGRDGTVTRVRVRLFSYSRYDLHYLYCTLGIRVPSLAPKVAESALHLYRRVHPGGNTPLHRVYPKGSSHAGASAPAFLLRLPPGRSLPVQLDTAVLAPPSLGLGTGLGLPSLRGCGVPSSKRSSHA